MGKRVTQLTREDWHYLILALRALAHARLVYAATPAGDIVAAMRRRNSDAKLPGASPSIDPQRLSWAIGAAAERVPWRADCLLRAMAAERVLRAAGHAPQFHLGVAKECNDRLTAHAWLTCDGETITGGDWTAYTALITSADLQ